MAKKRRKQRRSKSNTPDENVGDLGKPKESSSLGATNYHRDALVQKMKALIESGKKPPEEPATSATIEEVTSEAAHVGAALRYALDITGDKKIAKIVRQANKKPDALMQYCKERATRRIGIPEAAARAIIEELANNEIETVRRNLHVLFESLDETISADINRYTQNLDIRDEMLEYLAMYVEDGPTDQFFGKRHPELETWVEEVAHTILSTCKENRHYEAEPMQVLLSTLSGASTLIHRVNHSFFPRKGDQKTKSHPLYTGTEDVYCGIVVRVLELVLEESKDIDAFLTQIDSVINDLRVATNEQQYKIDTKKSNHLLVAIRSLNNVNWALTKFMQAAVNKYRLPEYVEALQEKYGQEPGEETEDHPFDTRGFVGILDIDTERKENTGYIFNGGKRMQTVLVAEHVVPQPYCFDAQTLCPAAHIVKVNSTCFANLTEDNQLLLHNHGYAGTPADIENREEATAALMSATDHFRKRLGGYEKQYPELFQMIHSWGPFFLVTREEKEYLLFRAPTEDRLVEVLDSVGKDEWELSHPKHKIFTELQLQVQNLQKGWGIICLSETQTKESKEEKQKPLEDTPTISMRKKLRNDLQEPTLHQFVTWLDRVEGVETAFHDPAYGQGSHGSIVVRRAAPKDAKQEWIDTRKNTWTQIKKPTTKLTWALVMEFLRDLDIEPEAFYKAATT